KNNLNQEHRKGPRPKKTCHPDQREGSPHTRLRANVEPFPDRPAGIRPSKAKQGCMPAFRQSPHPPKRLVILTNGKDPRTLDSTKMSNPFLTARPDSGLLSQASLHASLQTKPSPTQKDLSS